jgi:hypothetical protein
MSKTRQRRQSAYDSGVQDCKSGFGFRWKRHPNIRDYRAGYSSMKRDRPISIWTRLLRMMLGKGFN